MSNQASNQRQIPYQQGNIDYEYYYWFLFQLLYHNSRLNYLEQRSLHEQSPIIWLVSGKIKLL